MIKNEQRITGYDLMFQTFFVSFFSLSARNVVSLKHFRNIMKFKPTSAISSEVGSKRETTREAHRFVFFLKDFYTILKNHKIKKMGATSISLRSLSQSL